MTRHTIFRDFAGESRRARAVGAGGARGRYSRPCARASLRRQVNGASRLLAELRDRNVPTFINSATPTSALQKAPVGQGRGWTASLCGAGRTENGGDKVDNLAEIARRAGCAAAEVAHVGDGANDSAALPLRGLARFSNWRRGLPRHRLAHAGVAGAPRVTGAGVVPHL